MVEITLLSWRDIPAQILVGKGRNARRIMLPERFEAAIDRAAMASGLAGTDDYLGQWTRVAMTVEDPDQFAATLDAEHSPERLREIIAQGGYADARPDT